MAKVHADLEQVMISAAEDMGVASGRLATGQITVEEWRDAMRDGVRRLHTSSTALAQGGFNKISDVGVGRLESRIASELGYLEKFAAQIADGTQRVSWIDPVTGERMIDGRFASRASMYAESGHATMENARRGINAIDGVTHERRVLDDVENCDDCVGYALEGWQPIGTLPEIGDSQCMTNCRCEFEYKTIEDRNEQADGAEPPDVLTTAYERNTEGMLQWAARAENIGQTDANGQSAFYETVRRLGYDALPQKVSAEEYERLVAAGGKVMVRGVPEQAMAQQLISGRYYAGSGGWSNGIFTATGERAEQTAAAFARMGESPSPSLVKMVLNADAKVIDVESVRAEVERWRGVIASRIEAANAIGDIGAAADARRAFAVVGDPGTLAALMGYDVISLPRVVNASMGVDFTEYVLLNRGAVSMLSAPIPL